MNAAAAQAQQESFADLLEEFIETTDATEGSLIAGIVSRITNDFVIVEVPGLKSEGLIDKREFTQHGKAAPEKGDQVEVFVEAFENHEGEAVVSYEKALRERAWDRLEKAHNNQEQVKGHIFGRVKGGFTVDLGGAVAFLPGSQVDIRPVRDIDPLINVEQPFMVLKMDRKRGNIVVSRRAILEESREEERRKILSDITEGQRLEGIVKNITDYGAFVDLGGVDGLLHVTDISWKRINHPTEVLKLGDTIEVIITKYNPETQRISLGMKQLASNPWEGVRSLFPTGSRHKGKVVNVTDYGAFVELQDGLEGLIHMSEMSWTKKNLDPSKLLSPGDEVDVQVLEIDEEKHRISLGLKQTQENPWEAFAVQNPTGSKLEGKVTNVTDFGLFVDLGNGLEGLVHANDLSWDKKPEEAIKDFKKGDDVTVKILETQPSKERVALGIKQLTGGGSSDAPASSSSSSSDVGKGKVVTCKVTAVQKDGIEVELPTGGRGFIRRADLSRDKGEQRPERFAVGDRVDAKVTNSAKDKVTLSIKALELEQEKEAVKMYGSTESGASLGDILGEALGELKK